MKLDTCLELKTGDLRLGLLPGRHSRSEKPQRLLCELYAKLLGVLVQH